MSPSGIHLKTCLLTGFRNSNHHSERDDHQLCLNPSRITNAPRRASVIVQISLFFRSPFLFCLCLPILNLSFCVIYIFVPCRYLLSSFKFFLSNLSSILQLSSRPISTFLSCPLPCSPYLSLPFLQTTNIPLSCPASRTVYAFPSSPHIPVSSSPSFLLSTLPLRLHLIQNTIRTVPFRPCISLPNPPLPVRPRSSHLDPAFLSRPPSPALPV